MALTISQTKNFALMLGISVVASACSDSSTPFNLGEENSPHADNQAEDQQNDSNIESFVLPAFNFRSLTIEQDGTVKADWEDVEAEGKSVEYTLCQANPDDHEACIYLGSVTDASELYIKVNPLPLIDSKMFVIAEAGGQQASSNLYSVNFDSNSLNSMIKQIELPNSSDNQYMGYSVVLSADGETLAVAAPGERSNGLDPFDTSLTLAGAVYLYKRQNNEWQNIDYIKAPSPQNDDWFGYRVALNGNGSTLAVSMPRDPNLNNQKGSVFVYQYEKHNDTWQRSVNPPALIQPENSASDTENAFGESIALSGDGTTLVVGDPASRSNLVGDKDVVYIFRFDETNALWKQEDFFQSNDNMNIGGSSGGLNPNSSDAYGQSVSLNWDGNLLAVGAPWEDSASTGIGSARTGTATNSGAVYLYHYSNGQWDKSNEIYVKASNASVDEFFGFSVSLSGDGETLAVSAPLESSDAKGVNDSAATTKTGVPVGAVYIFRYQGNNWYQTDIIKAKEPELLDQFGADISLSYDGATLAVGAIGENSDTTGINGDTTLNTSSKTDSGAAYLFRFNGGNWQQVAFLKALQVIDTSSFGNSISLSDDGSTLAVGAPHKDSTHTNSGAVFVY
ncbi:FG-GAP repeat protein [Vibrio sonorensis]|uniref:FG-GAP repeat protein n=1 Tax=Vibrio sonorensis TaxID=1004316 RepID=UPI0008D9B70E|nr:FG-GAP repeat protein [Vibrio sonorensis]